MKVRFTVGNKIFILPIYINGELISQNVLQNFQFLSQTFFCTHKCQKPCSVFVYSTFSLKHCFLDDKISKNSFFEFVYWVIFTRLISQKVQDTFWELITPLSTISKSLEPKFVAYVSFYWIFFFLHPKFRFWISKKFGSTFWVKKNRYSDTVFGDMLKKKQWKNGSSEFRHSFWWHVFQFFRVFFNLFFWIRFVLFNVFNLANCFCCKHTLQVYFWKKAKCQLFSVDFDWQHFFCCFRVWFFFLTQHDCQSEPFNRYRFLTNKSHNEQKQHFFKSKK